MPISKYILSISSLLVFAGCTNRTVTDYENCVPAGVTLELKEELGIYIIDDSEGKQKYSSMNFPEGEYYLCIKEGMRCLNFSGEYYEGWNIIPVNSKTIQLTGKYKTNKPNGISSAFTPDTEALQVVIDGKRAWISDYELEESNVKESSKEKVRELRKNSIWPNDLKFDFKCPNTDVRESGQEVIYNKLF